jgi:hypothetical protein
LIEVVSADHRLAGCCADQAADSVAELNRHVKPACRVPAADQILTPFLVGGDGRFVDGGGRGCAKRIAVEVDQPLGQHKAVTHRAQRVRCVHGFNRG